MECADLLEGVVLISALRLQEFYLARHELPSVCYQGNSCNCVGVQEE